MTHLGDVAFRHVCTHKAHIRAPGLRADTRGGDFGILGVFLTFSRGNWQATKAGSSPSFNRRMYRNGMRSDEQLSPECRLKA
jgi:hypothetical protein